jgi:hypothetical protein
MRTFRSLANQLRRAPDAGTRIVSDCRCLEYGGGLIFKAGGPVGSNFDGNVDAFILRHNGALITYNFENVP